VRARCATAILGLALVVGAGPAPDARLGADAPVFAFELGARTYAAPHAAIAGGAVFDLGGTEIFLFRPREAAGASTTSAYFAIHAGADNGPRFQHVGGQWRDTETGAVFVEGVGFEPADSLDDVPRLERPVRVAGIDTTWRIWSSAHRDVVLLGASP